MSEYATITCQIHLENGIYLTTMVNEKRGIVYQLQNAIYPCRVYADPDMVAALIAEQFTIWSIGTRPTEWDMAVDVNAHDRCLSIQIRTAKNSDASIQNANGVTVYEGTFDEFLAIEPEEIGTQCNLETLHDQSDGMET
jgi:hypothetical protein